MSRKSLNLKSFTYWLDKSQQHFRRIPVLIWLNILTIVVLSLLSIYARIRSKGQNIEILFSDPFNIGTFYLGWFTAVSETLWCTAIAICLFTCILLPKSQGQFKFFTIVSALIMSLLYFDDRFRFTLILCVFFGTCKIVKTSVYLTYGALLIFYAWQFRHVIRQTPYVPLLMSLFLFGFSSAIDITPLSSRGIHAMLEDGTKLIGLINMTIYFWYICQQRIKIALIS